MAWFKSNDGEGYEAAGANVAADGSYSIDFLGSKPVYVMAIHRVAKEGIAYPPIYYPGTFFRTDAKLITFDKKQRVDNIDIKLQREGGLILKGSVVDEAGRPVPEAFVVVNRRDMLFDLVTAYSDEQGRYQIQGLGNGGFQVHVDAVHRGFVRTRIPIDLDQTSKTRRRNFTLKRGVLISGKLVDEKGNDWPIGWSYGLARIVKNEHDKDWQNDYGSFSTSGFRNKYWPQEAEGRSGDHFRPGQGDYDDGQMIFPTKSTFVIQGMMPGHTMLSFSPKKKGQKVVRILQGGRDIMESGIDTQPGQEIKDVTIVIGTAAKEGSATESKPAPAQDLRAERNTDQAKAIAEIEKLGGGAKDTIPPSSPDKSATKEHWSLTLKETLLYALQNSKVIRQIGVQVQGGPTFLASSPEVASAIGKPGGATPGFNQGVFISRANTDISLTAFEKGVRNLISDVDAAYWELYFAHRNLQSAVQGRDRALQTWQKVKASGSTAPKPRPAKSIFSSAARPRRPCHSFTTTRTSSAT